MNTIREINRINERELELGVKGSWHDEYKDSAYVYVGGLAFELTEGDVITIFSQFGEILDVNLPRDKETGKTRGFGFLMYEDQRSTVLAVDNMNGAQVLGRTLRVDHTRNYRQPGKKNEEGDWEAPEEPTYNAMPPVIDDSDDDSSSAASSAADSLDEEDPMAAFIRAEKKAAKAAGKKEKDKGGKKRKHEGESKEERKRRKEEKRERKERKKSGKEKAVGGGRSLMDKERDRRHERDDRGKTDRGERDDRDHSVKRERERDGWDHSRAPKGRADRDDWRVGKFELEKEEADRAGRARAEPGGDGRDRRAPPASRERDHDDGRERERERERRYKDDGWERERERERDRRPRDDDRGERRRDDSERRRH